MKNGVKFFLFRTWYGAFAVNIVAGLSCCVLYWWLGVYDRLAFLMVGVVGLAACVLLVSVYVGISNLLRSKFRLALLQLFLCFVSLFALCLGLGIETYALMFSERYADEFRKEQRWNQVSLTNGIPFSIEFRARHPIYSWYDSRVVFASGKRSGVMSGLHYPRAYDVIRLAPSVFSLMPMDVSTNHSCTYCVDVDKEAVWVRCGAHLTAVPNESAGVVKRLDGSLLFNVRTDMIEVKDSPVPYGNDLNRLHCGAFEAPSAYEK